MMGRQSSIKFVATLLASSMLFNATLNAGVMVIESEKEFNDLLESKRPAVVKFSAEWCGACKTVAPDFEAVAQDDAFKNVAFVKVDMDKLSSVGQRYNVTGMPTFVFIENGSEKTRHVGASPDFQNTFRGQIKDAFGASLAATSVEEGPVVAAEEQATPAHTPEKEMPAAEGGFVAQIKALVMAIVNGIKHVVMSVVDAIKGLFSK